MPGLVASMLLRCDDCIKYHLGKSHEMGVTNDQVYEIFAVANIEGGTIVIPHTSSRRRILGRITKVTGRFFNQLIFGFKSPG